MKKIKEKSKPNAQVEQLREEDINLITKNNNKGVCSNAKLGMCFCLGVCCFV